VRAAAVCAVAVVTKCPGSLDVRSARRDLVPQGCVTAAPSWFMAGPRVNIGPIATPTARTRSGFRRRGLETIRFGQSQPLATNPLARPLPPTVVVVVFPLGSQAIERGYPDANPYHNKVARAPVRRAKAISPIVRLSDRSAEKDRVATRRRDGWIAPRPVVQRYQGRLTLVTCACA
jgi:hypothetical protein